MEKKILKRIFNESNWSNNHDRSIYGCGSLLFFVFAITSLVFSSNQDSDTYALAAFFMGLVLCFVWLSYLLKKNKKINELKHLNIFIYNQLEANNYFSDFNDRNSYFNKYILKPRWSYEPFYKNKVPLSHNNDINFLNDFLEKENIGWELSDPQSCEINSSSDYEIIGRLRLSNLVKNNLNGGGLRYIDLKKGRTSYYTPLYRQFFPRRVNDKVMFALKERTTDNQRNKIIFISKNELCLFNIIHASKKT